MGLWNAAERRVVVASRNPAKISAAKAAAQRCFPGTPLKVFGVESLSRVPDQPVGCEQTLQGALNRIHSIQQQQGQPWPPESLLVSVEGGVLLRKETELHCFAWAAVRKATSGRISTARSAEFLLPTAVAALILQGMDLGAADDKVFGRLNSGQGSGTIGHLTRDIITRADYYEHAFVMALIPYIHPKLYPEFH